MKGEYIEVSLEELTTPRNGLVCHCNRWWITRNGNPLFYSVKKGKYLYPQCNPDEHTARYLLEKSQELKGCELLFVPVAYVKNNPD